MGSVLLLFSYDKTRQSVLQFSVPIWELTGTFGAYWVVTSYFTYPTLLLPIATLFAPFFVVFLIFFVARNSSVVFGEFIIKKAWLDEKKLYQAYAATTFVVGLLALVVVSALLSGAGIKLSGGLFSVVGWISSPGSVVFIIGTLVLGVGLAPAFFNLKSLRRQGFALTVAGVAISILSYYLYSSKFISALIAIPSVLTILAAALYLSDKTSKIVTNKAVFLTLLTIIIFSLQFLVYPTFLGRSVSVDSVTTSGVVGTQYLTISVVGGILLAVMVGLFVLVIRRKSALTTEGKDVGFLKS